MIGSDASSSLESLASLSLMLAVRSLEGLAVLCDCMEHRKKKGGSRVQAVAA